jgi:acetyl-CoA carboxylase carboxyl transferase subunit alpha
MEAMASNLKTNLKEVLESLQATPMDKLLEQRYQRLMQYGNYVEK